MADLTTTSYAVLGLLAIQPWSAYELEQYMSTSALRTVWPRAASSIYREPKALVEHGFADVRRERHRGPERSVYSINRAGRRALSRWLGTPHTAYRYEDEGLVQVLFSDHGTRKDLLAQIEAMRDAAERALVETGIEEIAAKGLRFPGRSHVGALVLRHGLEQIAARLRWCRWARAEVMKWPLDLELDEAHLSEIRAVYDPDWIRDFLGDAGSSRNPR